jgi:hypothetical protein
MNPFLAAAEDWWAPRTPAWKVRAVRAFDRAALLALAHDPARGIRRIGQAGRVAHACGLQQPAGRDVRALLPDLTSARAREAARASAALRLQNLAAIALARRDGLASLAPLLDDACSDRPPLLSRTRGIVLAGWHVGAHFGVTAALHRWGVAPYVLRDRWIADGQARARVLREAVDVIRQGGVVLVVADGPAGVSTAPLPCLGRRIVLRRGGFALARLTGAPMAPVVARWTAAGRITTRLDEPLDAGGSGADGDEREHALAAAAAAWLDGYVRARPEDLWPYTLRNLLAAPPIDAA